MAPQKSKENAKQPKSNKELKRKPFHKIGNKQQEKVSKKQAKTAALKQRPKYVLQTVRQDRNARSKKTGQLFSPLTAENTFEQNVWATYGLIKARCQPSKENLLAAAADEPDKQLEDKAVYAAYPLHIMEC
jgi:hypothetical protein